MIALNRPWQRFSRSEQLALAIGALGLLVFATYLAPLWRENASLERQVAEALVRQAGNPAASMSPEVARFLGALPTAQQRGQDIARLGASARQQGLRLGQMSFDEATPAAADLFPTALNGRMSVEGSYPTLRKWLNEVWSSMPSLAVASLRVRQPANVEGRLQAQLELTYYSGAPAGDGAAASGRRQRNLATEAKDVLDLFALQSVAVRRAPPAPVQKPPGKSPALPFTYGGSYRSAGHDVYLLLEGENVHRVRLGETLADRQFRLEKATRNELELTHLPTSSRYTLSTGNQSQ